MVEDVDRNIRAFISLAGNPFRFKVFLLSKLPAAYFSGIRVKYIDEIRSIVTIPYKWFTKNPFHSTYFACLSMAAEMSTGLLAMMNTYRRDPKVSMLVTNVESEFVKKATGVIEFTCDQGSEVSSAIESCILNNKAVKVKMKAQGLDSQGAIVAIFFITWSFKPKFNK